MAATKLVFKERPRRKCFGTSIEATIVLNGKNLEASLLIINYRTCGSGLELNSSGRVSPYLLDWFGVAGNWNSKV
ncbi:uncharacterized protein EAE98_008814 [Botrytis deweyae]|uniref:Uncharacterized protein n=1 Tax=Botrytis deweyae TaxID=2478750 RepID=A0ABQ7ID56_9HELO|nr:uncharacterized protein EAE98_008814 [Botrytis deweyae]KAF7920785.1 hypothetical protein EAE98_008814 [Botrytis deweyae]